MSAFPHKSERDLMDILTEEYARKVVEQQMHRLETRLAKKVKASLGAIGKNSRKFPTEKWHMAKNYKTDPCGGVGDCGHSDLEHWAFDRGHLDGRRRLETRANPYKRRKLRQAWEWGHEYGLQDAKTETPNQTARRSAGVSNCGQEECSKTA